MDSKKTVPFQRNQMQKIVDIMGMPTKERWPLLTSMPEYAALATLSSPMGHLAHHHRGHGGVPQGSSLEKWYWTTVSQSTASNATQAAQSTAPLVSLGVEGYKLLASLLEYDPVERLTAAKALQHPFFSTGDRLNPTAFEGLKNEYPHRRVSQDDNDIRTNSLPGTKRSGLPDDSLRPDKRMKH
jgi:cyclin-dependent kinase 8/11